MSVNIPSTWWNNPNRLIKSSNEIVQLDNVPSLITASNNRQRFRYTYRTEPTPQKARLVFSVSSVPDTIINTLSIAFASGISFRRRFSLTPTFGEIITFTTNTLQNQQAVAEAIAYELQNDPLITLYYDVFSDANDIYITSKGYSPTFNIGYIPTPAFFINQLQNSTARFAYQNRIDYNTFFRVFTNNQILFGQTTVRPDFTQIGELLLQPNEAFVNHFTQQFTSNFVDYILPQVNTLPQTVLSTTLDMAAGTKKHLKPYFILYGDSYRYVVNGDIKYRTVGVSEILWTQIGNKDLLDPYSFAPNIIDTNSFDNAASLTLQPIKKRVYKDSQEFIQFIIKYNTTSILWSIRVDITFFDGTSTNINYNGGDLNGIGGNFVVDVSPFGLDLANIEAINGKLIKEYTVRFAYVNSQQVLSEPITYTFEHDCNINTTHFIWLNENGAWDSFTFIGDTVTTTDFEDSTIQTPLSFDPIVSQEVNKVYRKEQTRTHTVNSGLLNPSNYQFLFGLIQSNAIFIWDSGLNEYKSVQIVEQNYNSINDGNPKDLQISYRLSYDINTLKK